MNESKSTMHVQSLDTVIRALLQLNTVGGMAWRDIAKMDAYKGIPAGTLCAIAKGREPKNPHYREILRLPVLAPAPVCAKCGAVHVTKRCTANGKPAGARWVRVPGHAGGEWR